MYHLFLLFFRVVLLIWPVFLGFKFFTGVEELKGRL